MMYLIIKGVLFCFGRAARVKYFFSPIQKDLAVNLLVYKLCTYFSGGSNAKLNCMKTPPCQCNTGRQNRKWRFVRLQWQLTKGGVCGHVSVVLWQQRFLKHHSHCLNLVKCLFLDTVISLLGKYNMSSSVLCSTEVLTLPFILFDPFYTKAFLWTIKRNFSNCNIVSRHKQSKTICLKWTSEKLLIGICSWLVAKQRCSPFDFCNTRGFFFLWVPPTNVHDSTFRKIEQ